VVGVTLCPSEASGTGERRSTVTRHPVVEQLFLHSVSCGVNYSVFLLKKGHLTVRLISP